jgi:predicted RNA-binding Zn-ribbon protein involved in translation (DUF1610 family)
MGDKITEEMWCYSCDHEWITEDYHNCNKCPKCGETPIYRQSSFSFVYAYLAKHPKKIDLEDK